MNYCRKKQRKLKRKTKNLVKLQMMGSGMNIFLLMTGTIDNPDIKYDSKGAIQNIKQDLKVEKQTLKTILKEEFGLFKKDSTLNSNKQKEETKFTIKWEESDKKRRKKS